MAESFLVNPRQFQFELVAPERVEVTAFEERVVLPGEEGDFMVMAGHTPMLAGLRPGLVSVIRANNSVVRYFITGGFVDVGNGHCTVLTPHVTPLVKIVADKVARDIAHLEEELANDDIDPSAKTQIESKIKILLIQLEAAEKYNV